MAVFDALLKIRAAVSGEGDVAGLGRALGGVGRTANAVTGSIKGLTAAAGMGGLAGAMGTLTPLLSVAGLAGMAKGALEAGDMMNDLSQKTGIAVESLARFKKAAATSGTDLETVAKASMKLSKGMFEAANTGKGPASDALKTLGLSATDASGKLKSTDDLMLQIATKFKAMPDGVEKTALAMQLFGKSGAELIPMLNQGGDAIDKMKVKMTAAFAERADEYSDKLTMLSGKVGALGMDIMVALLPALETLTNGLMTVVDAFNGVDPSLRAVIVTLSLLALAWGPITGLIAGVTTSLLALVAAVPTAIAALSGLLAFISSTLIPGLLAFFSGPAGWTVLAIAAVVAMAIAFREPIGSFLKWLGELFPSTVSTIMKAVYDAFLKPWVTLYNVALRQPVQDLINWFRSSFSTLADIARRPFDAVVEYVRSAINGVLRFIVSGINAAIALVNNLIAGYNQLPAPDIPLIPSMAIPAFAEGGVVDRPTLAMVGEGGEREYIIPESKMAAAAASYLSGSRGNAVLSPSTINITTGPVMQQDGKQWVSMTDLQRAMRQTENMTIARMRTFYGRRATGIA